MSFIKNIKLNMEMFKTSVFVVMLIASVVKIQGASILTEDRLNKLERITQKLVNELTEKERRIEKLETLVGDQRKELEKQQRGQSDGSRSRRQSSDNVAFHAYLKGNRCYGSHETFVFDVEETDIGDAYNVHDGIFDVPVTGTYVFTVTTVSNARRYYSAEIIINGEVKGISFADAEEVGDIHSGTATIVVHVNAGDHVFVRRGAAATNNCDVYSLDVYGRTTFSGWLLF